MSIPMTETEMKRLINIITEAMMPEMENVIRNVLSEKLALIEGEPVEVKVEKPEEKEPKKKKQTKKAAEEKEPEKKKKQTKKAKAAEEKPLPKPEDVDIYDESVDWNKYTVANLRKICSINRIDVEPSEKKKALVEAIKRREFKPEKKTKKAKSDDEKPAEKKKKAKPVEADPDATENEEEERKKLKKKSVAELKEMVEQLGVEVIASKPSGKPVKADYIDAIMDERMAAKPKTKPAEEEAEEPAEVDVEAVNKEVEKAMEKFEDDNEKKAKEKVKRMQEKVSVVDKLVEELNGGEESDDEDGPNVTTVLNQFEEEMEGPEDGVEEESEKNEEGDLVDQEIESVEDTIEGISKADYEKFLAAKAMHGGKNATVKKIAEESGLSNERVQRIHDNQVALNEKYPDATAKKTKKKNKKGKK